MKTMLANMEREVNRVLKHTKDAQLGSVGSANCRRRKGCSTHLWQVVGKMGGQYRWISLRGDANSSSVYIERTKKIRKRWAVAFHIFWEGAMMVAKEVQLLYNNIDEKWFYSLVIRLHNKAVPLFGVSPVFPPHSSQG